MKSHKLNAFGDAIYSPIDVLSDHGLTKVLQRVFLDICRDIGLTLPQSNELTKILWSEHNRSSVEYFEKHLHEQFKHYISKKKLALAFERRASLIAEQVSPFLVGESVADIGCGDGMVAWFLRHNTSRMFLIDIAFYLDRRVSFPFYPYADGKRLPLQEPVDTSLLLTVLHHSKNPIRLLQETRKITSTRLIVIESVIGVKPSKRAPKSYLYNLTMPQQRKYASFIDWLYNRVLHKDVPVPYNYLTPHRWRKVFEAHGWSVSQFIDLGVDQAVVPEHHVLFVLDAK